MGEGPEAPDEQRGGSGPAIDPLLMSGPYPEVGAAGVAVVASVIVAVAAVAFLVSKVRGRGRVAIEGDEADE